PETMVKFSSLADGRLTILNALTWTVVVAPFATAIVSAALVPLTVTVSVPATASTMNVVPIPKALTTGTEPTEGEPLLRITVAAAAPVGVTEIASLPVVPLTVRLWALALAFSNSTPERLTAPNVASCTVLAPKSTVIRLATVADAVKFTTSLADGSP